MGLPLEKALYLALLERTWALCLLLGRANMGPLSPQQHGKLCCLSERYAGLGIRQDPRLSTWLRALVLG